MYTARRFPVLPALQWTRRALFASGAWSTIITVAYTWLGWQWIGIPALPLTTLGVAVSFYLGFKGNAAYDRLWEARKIWGGIVNTSRTWGTQVTTYIGRNHPDHWEDSARPALHRELIYRQIAWMAALRTQLRRERPWEHRHGSDDNWRHTYGSDQQTPAHMRERMKDLLDPEELDWVMARRNQATQLLYKQMTRIAEIRDEGLLDSFEHLQLAGSVQELYTLMGKCERIKNFPLPRQYSSLNHWFVLTYLFLVPFGLVRAFHDIAPEEVWLTIPAHMLLSWVFYMWDMVVDQSENPFEGLQNDIPMTTISRAIEIDLREMLGETDLPPDAPQPAPNIQM